MDFTLLAGLAPKDWLTYMLGAGAALGGIGYALGQFVSSRRKGISDSLDIALQEVEAIKLRALRYEEELKELRAELDTMRTENKTLRDLLVGGAPFVNTLETSIKEAVGHHTAVVIEAIRTEFEKRGAS